MSNDSKTIDRNDSKGAAEFNDIACNVFAPIYPVIAGQALDRCGIKEGVCIDLGCGPALLAIAMAKITPMKVYALDHSPTMLGFAMGHIKKENLTGRVFPVTGDVHHLPFPDDSVDIMISRGSVLFWEDKATAFREIKRVLRQKGKSFIGCGLGSKELREAVSEKMRQREKDWDKSHKDRKFKQNPEELKKALADAGVKEFEVTRDDAGLWIYLEA